MADDAAQVHIAGLDVSVGPQVRQRCAWCGAVIIDQDLTRIAVPLEDADRPFPTWKVGALISVDRSSNPWVTWVVDEPEDGKLPDNACAQLPHEVTGAVMA